jgi:soluble lytic murein transglycosylase-like protein
MRAICPMARHAIAATALMALLGAGPAPATAQRATDQNASTPPASSPAASSQTRSRSAAPALPHPLRAEDAQRLRRAFEAQARGDLATAQREAEHLADRRLIGHLLADRLLRANAEPALPALRSWLAEHADLPDAPAIHEVLVRRLPQGAAVPPPPVPPEARLPFGDLLPEEAAPAPAGPRNPRLERAVRTRLAEGKGEEALALIVAERAAAPALAAELATEVAQTLFRRGQDAAALRAATAALALDPRNALAAHQAGLAAWALGQYEKAFAHFERAAREERAPPSVRAAAAFWTARAAVRARQPSQYVPWMLQAAQEPRTFYGMIARRSLGLPAGLTWDRNIAGDTRAEALAETAAGWRALALLQIGQDARAEAELQLLLRRARSNPQVVHGILAVAQQRNMAGVVAAVASLTPADTTRAPDAARFPLPTLRPPQGFRMDPALLYGLALQESRFNTDAVSRAGARGLLQIMPATASYVANDPSLRHDAVHRLHDPGFGLEIGQRYVHYLARHETVRGDLIRLLAAYNAGPGNLGRWLPAAQHRADPLLFIESIPIAETRAFVQRVLTFSWIYANRLDLPAPSLDALAGGQFPRFAGVEEVTAMLREHPRRLH